MLKVRPPLIGQEAEKINEGSTVISFLYPAQNKSIVDALAIRKANAFAVRFLSQCFVAQQAEYYSRWT